MNDCINMARGTLPSGISASVSKALPACDRMFDALAGPETTDRPTDAQILSSRPII